MVEFSNDELILIESLCRTSLQEAPGFNCFTHLKSIINKIENYKQSNR